MDAATCLPKELMEFIFTFLDAKELSVVSKVSKLWRTRANYDPLWLHHCMVRGWLLTHNAPSGSSLEQICKWKDVFIRVSHLNTNWETGRYTVTPLYRAHSEKITALDCDGEVLVSGSHDQTMKWWDLKSLKCVRTCNTHADTVTGIKIQNGYVVSGCGDGSLRVFSVETGEQLFSLYGHHGCVEHLQFDGETIVSGGADKSVKVWSVSCQRLLHSMVGHTDEIEVLRVCSATWALTGSWDTTLILWDTKHGTAGHVMREHTEAVNCCQFDTERIVSGSGDCLVKLWDFATGSCCHTFAGHTAEVYCVVYNEEMIASGSADSTVRVWNFDGSPAHVLGGHLGVVRCLYLCGNRLVSGGDQKKIIIWDGKAGRQLCRLHRNPTLLHLMLASDTRIVTGSPDKPGTITVLHFW